MDDVRWKRWARRTRIPHLTRAAWNTALSPLQPEGLVLLNSGRCGSTVLSWMLHAHPRVFSHGEVFLRYERAAAGRRRRPRPLAYLRRDMRLAGRRHYVFSLHFLPGQHLRPEVVDMPLEAFLDAVQPLGIERIALLERRNSLRAIVSKHVGELRDRWHRRPGEDAEPARFELDPASVDFARVRLPLLDWLEAFERGFAEARPLVADRGGICLTYEDDVLPDPVIGYRKLCAALGVEAAEVAVPLRRATPFPIADVVTNLAEIERELRGTRFAWMLEDS